MARSAWPSGQGQAPALCPLPGYSPWERLKMTEALKVSPAPRVSTTRGGGKALEWSSRPSGPRASAPSSAQAQTSVALRHPHSAGCCPHAPAPGPQPRPPPPPPAQGRPRGSEALPPRTPGFCLASPAHPFLTRPYRPLRASTADRNPKCLATSLLTNTCGQGRRADLGCPSEPIPTPAQYGALWPQLSLATSSLALRMPLLQRGRLSPRTASHCPAGAHFHACSRDARKRPRQLTPEPLACVCLDGRFLTIENPSGSRAPP